jgi:hypothetical protein
MSVRKFNVARALESFPSLGRVINELTEEEVLVCLELEAATRRRRSIVDRLIARAVRLREISYGRQLKEKFRGTTQENPVP